MGRAVIYVKKVEDMWTPVWDEDTGVERKDPILRPRGCDACLCDPPYGLEFMGHGWDRGVPPADTWRVVRDAMKPGAVMLAFGGTRMWHRLATEIETAGFEIRDTLMWLYGTGFPKGSDVSKGIDRKKGAVREKRRHASRPGDCGWTAGKGDTRPWIEKAKEQGFYEAPGDVPVTEAAGKWNGYGTALKPAWEPIIMAQRPAEGTYIGSALDYGVGALNIAGSRVGTSGGCKSTEPMDPNNRKEGTVFGPGSSGLNSQRSPQVEGLGRWPANVILDPEAAAIVDRQSGQTKSTKEINRTGPTTRHTYSGGWKRIPAEGYGDEGGASRYFKVINPDHDERVLYMSKASPGERGDNKHPTLKPLRLCEYLARMILPPARDGGVKRRLLVPFSGSGTELLAGLRAGWEEVVGIEMDGEYMITTVKRLEAEGHEVKLK